jgi:hypothetical protein
MRKGRRWDSQTLLLSGSSQSNADNLITIRQKTLPRLRSVEPHFPAVQPIITQQSVARSQDAHGRVACDEREKRQYQQLNSALSSKSHSHRAFTPIPPSTPHTLNMALDSFFHNKIESMKLEIIQGQAVLRRLEAQRNDYNSRGMLVSYELQDSI